MRKILLYIAVLLFSVGLSAQPISLNSTNPHYFTYRGEPIVIVTSGEHYGAVLNTDFDYVTYLSTLASAGLNGTRLCAGANVEWDGWFDIAENTWAPDVGSYIGPWARATSGTYYNGGYAFDLTDWDEAYFIRLKDFVQEAAVRDIVVELFFFSYIYYDNEYGDLLWSYNPMNTINNINGIGAVDYDEVYTTTDATMLGLQKDLVEKIVTELNQYDNIIWEIMNEPYMSPPITSAWEDTIIKVITETEALLSKQHLISQNIGNFSHTISSPNAATDLFNLHYAYAGTAYTVNDGINKALGNNETGFTQSDAQYRQECYIALTSGAAYFNVLDYSFTVGDEDGTTLPTGNPSGGGPTLRTQIAYAKDFIESFDYIDMSPDNTVINSVSAGVDGYCLAEDGEQYALFIDGVTGFLQLDLTAGTYYTTWIDTKTGIETTDLLAHPSGGLVTIYPPTYTEDISLSLVKYVAVYVPSTPKSVRAGGMLLKHQSDAVSYLELGTDTLIIPPNPDQVKVFDDTITMVYEPISTGGYGFYWWHRPDEEGITNFGDMPIASWEVPHDYYEGNFTITAEVISQPTNEPFYIQFGIWQDYGVSNYPETVAGRQYLDGGVGSSGEWALGSPSTWWNKEPTDSVDFSRADDFFRIGVVLWNADPLCIPKGTAWGTDGCPEYAYQFFPLEIAISVYASSDSSSIPVGPTAPSSMTFSSVAATSMRINWTDNSSDENNFVLERGLSSGGTFTEIASPTTNYYDDSGLTSGVRYYYRVAAENDIGVSTWATGNKTLSTSSVTNILIIGNSIANTTYDSLLIEYPGRFVLYDLSVSGDKIGDQLDDWDTWSAANPTELASLDYVCLAPIGVNDVAEGNNDLSQATIEASYNALITQINSDIGTGTQIVLSAMTPAKGSEFVSDVESDKLVSINNTFIATPPANVDISYSTNFSDLTDGADGLFSWYDSGDGIHPGWLGRNLMRENLLDAITWTDTINYTTHFLEDFEDFSTTNVSTASAPVGVTLTALQTNLYGFRDKQSDGGANGDPNLATTMDIMDIEGSRASVHWYVEGMCCTAAASDDNSNGTNDNIGTGVHIECDMDNSPGRYILFGWNEWAPDSFVISDGVKNSGIRNGFGTGYAMARTMTITSQTDSDLAFYTNGYYSGYSLPIERQTNTKSLSPEEWNTKGRWVHHSFLAYLGTEGNSDGYMEAFRDGVMEDPTVWPPARRSSIPYLKTGDNTTWSIFSIETFMGGGVPSYNSTLTQFRIIDDFFAVSFDNISDYGYPHSPGDVIYLPTIANFPKQ